MAEWLCSGLQSRVRRFDPDPSLGLARVAEQVDARDLKSLGILSRAGSIPASGKEFDNLEEGAVLLQEYE